MFFTILLFTLIASIDSFTVGIAYGIRALRIPLSSYLTIFICSISITFFSWYLGKVSTSFLTSSYSKIIGVALLLFIGIWIIYQALKNTSTVDNNIDNKNNFPYEQKTLFSLVIKSLGITIQIIKNPTTADVDKSGTLDIKESILICIALSVDSIGVIFGITMLGITSFAVPLLMSFFLIMTFILGYRLSLKLPKKYTENKIISILPGIILILLAIFNL